MNNPTPNWPDLALTTPIVNIGLAAYRARKDDQYKASSWAGR